MLKSFKKELRKYPYLNKEGFMSYHQVLYTLFFENNVLVDIRNESYFSVERSSECGNFFFNKYKN